MTQTLNLNGYIGPYDILYIVDRYTNMLLRDWNKTLPKSTLINILNSIEHCKQQNISIEDLHEEINSYSQLTDLLIKSDVLNKPIGQQSINKNSLQHIRTYNCGINYLVFLNLFNYLKFAPELIIKTTATLNMKMNGLSESSAKQILITPFTKEGEDFSVDKYCFYNLDRENLIPNARFSMIKATEVSGRMIKGYGMYTLLNYNRHKRKFQTQSGTKNMFEDINSAGPMMFKMHIPPIYYSYVDNKNDATYIIIPKIIEQEINSTYDRMGKDEQTVLNIVKPETINDGVYATLDTNVVNTHFIANINAPMYEAVSSSLLTNFDITDIVQDSDNIECTTDVSAILLRGHDMSREQSDIDQSEDSYVSGDDISDEYGLYYDEQITGDGDEYCNNTDDFNNSDYNSDDDFDEEQIDSAIF